MKAFIFIRNSIINYIKVIENWLSDIRILQISTLAFLSLSIFLIILLFIKTKINKTLKLKYRNLDNLISCINGFNGLGSDLNEILVIFDKIIAVQCYSFYIYDEINHQYILSAIRYPRSDPGAIAPSYSGLAPYEKGIYLPPATIDNREIPEKVSIINDDKGRILFIPIKGLKGVICMGPVGRVSKNLVLLFETMSIKLEPVLNVLMNMEKLKNKIEVAITTSNAMNNIASIMMNDRNAKELSESYLDMLKILSRAHENNKPYTVGYSDMMYRYSYILARELNINADESREIAIAASLCNIGALGLSNELLLKKGRYTDAEYGLMKLHSDVGASFIKITISNDKIASYIRHHHERFDGFGYPSGLKGGEIPLGARIINVVQTFIAKISGREGRSPLGFENAINTLEATAGTQLDPKATEAFIKWYGKKRANAINGRMLGPCWEMRCSPENICINCPAYKKYDSNCWENQNVNCTAHGNRCETCFIFTENRDRNLQSLGAK